MNFNRIANLYDSLVHLVFANTLQNAKTSLLSSVFDGAKVLIIGGGTGSVLDYLNKNNKWLKIDYVDSSSIMIDKAKLRSTDNLEINFLSIPIEKFTDLSYDFVITEFVLDLFEKVKLEELIARISNMLGANGQWIDTDFRPATRTSDVLLLKLMYLFFRISVNIEASALSDPQQFYSLNGLAMLQEVSFNRGFITSRQIARY